MRGAVWIGLLVAWGLVACGGGGDGDDDDDLLLPDADTTRPDAPPSSVTHELVELTTTDGKNIVGWMSIGLFSDPGSPGILLLHQFQRDKEQWGTFSDELATNGYRVLAIDLRGHGQSDPYDGILVDMLTDPNGPTLDVDAALAYLAGDGQADPDRIGIVGTSIGANLTVAAAVKDQAQLYVSVSARESAVEIYAGGAAQGMVGVYYLASVDDGAGVQAASAQKMYDNTAQPRELSIWPGSAHGVTFFEDTQYLMERDNIVDWIKSTL